MRIALFTDTFPPQINGVANHVETLASGLVQRGHTVIVVTVSADKAFGGKSDVRNDYELLSLPSLPAMVAPGLRAGLPSPFLLDRMRDFKPAIIHVHTPMLVGWMGVHVARRLKIPIVGTHHTFFDVYLREAGLRAAERLSWRYVMSFYNRCARIIAPSHAMMSALEAHAPTRPVVCIENGIDVSRFMPMQHDPADPMTFVYLGRLSREKRIHAIIEAFAAVGGDDSRLLIIGDGPEKAEMILLAEKLGIAQRVEFTGFLTGKPLVSRLRKCQAFISASEFENMPLSVLEAMACGLPVIAVKSLGMAEIIRDGREGYLAEDGSPESLSRLIALMAGDREDRERMSGAARARALDFSQEEMLGRIEALYAELA